MDKESGKLPAADELQERDDAERIHARSVMLSAQQAGLIARIDLIEAEGSEVTPVDYKKGEPPDIPERAWEPERVQLCAQGLILQENGYNVHEGVIYFVAVKRRVTIPFDDALRSRTRALLADLRQVFAAGVIPPPLKDSPKCPRCSLVGICLPDEVNYLRIAEPEEEVEPQVRRLLAARDDALPLYVQEAGARVGKRDEELTIQPREGSPTTVRLAQTSQVSLFGGVQITTQALQAILGRGLPVCFLSHGGWFYGFATGMPHKNVELRQLQYRAADDRSRCLSFATRFVATKIRNCRTMLRRNGDVPEYELDRLKELAEQSREAESAESLLGIEGTAARIYFQWFGGMLRPPDESLEARFEFDGRNRRPPRDPVNALLSFGYSMLLKDLTLAVLAVGFDPLLGFYHRPRYGRPALALDLMEEFRPIIADSVVLTAINTGVVRPGDFLRRGGAVSLTEPARIRVIRAYERRMDELVTHPVFGYRISYRRVLEVQARLLARHLAGEIPEYPGFLTR